MAQPPISRPKLEPLVDMKLEETFVDSLLDLVFDGNTFRLEFVVNRIDMTSPKSEREGKRVPVARLILPTPGFIDLCNKLNRMMAALESQGIVKLTEKGDRIEANNNPHSLSSESESGEAAKKVDEE